MSTKTQPKSLVPLTIAVVITLLVGCGPPATKPAEVNAETWGTFEAILEYLRQHMKIPGMSAAVVMDQKLGGQ